jgi:phosphohistidine phosphatase
MRVLLILRHAKSSWKSDALGDHERPLNPRGVRDAPRMGALLEEQDLVPDLIISSDAVRARMTAEAVVKTSGYAAEIVFDPRLYLASPDDIIAVLRSTPSAGARTVMIVGHNPGLEDLVAQLTGEEREFPTAALAAISLPLERWNDLATDSRGALLALWRPKDLT